MREYTDSRRALDIGTNTPKPRPCWPLLSANWTAGQGVVNPPKPFGVATAGASTSCAKNKEVVARHRAGHDEGASPAPGVIPPQGRKTPLKIACLATLVALR
jgi:hypothetical protein